MSEKKGKADNIDRLVSRRLKVRRMMLGLSQYDLGSVVDVTVQQVQKYENASNRISSGKLYSFAKLLKVPVTYFYEGGDDTNNTIGSIFAESEQKNISDNKDSVTEKEIVTLIKAFSEIKSPQSRKKITELVRTMH